MSKRESYIAKLTPRLVTWMVLEVLWVKVGVPGPSPRWYLGLASHLHSTQTGHFHLLAQPEVQDPEESGTSLRKTERARECGRKETRRKQQKIKKGNQWMHHNNFLWNKHKQCIHMVGVEEDKRGPWPLLQCLWALKILSLWSATSARLTLLITSQYTEQLTHTRTSKRVLHYSHNYQIYNQTYNFANSKVQFAFFRHTSIGF